MILLIAGWLIPIPWLSLAKEPGGIPVSKLLYVVLIYLAFFCFWLAGLLNLIRDVDRGYSNWGISIAAGTFLIAGAFPAYLFVPLLLGLSK